MIGSLALAALAVACVVLARTLARRRRLVARLSRAVDDAERLATRGPLPRWSAGEHAPAGSVEAPARSSRTRDPDDEIDRLSRTLERLSVRMAQDVAAVEAERRKLEDILAGVPEGVLVTGPDRVPIYANRIFRSLFDLDPGVRTEELLALVRRPQVHEAIARATAGEVPPAFELQIAPREVSVLARRLEAVAGVLLMVRDVTEANRVARMRRDFVTNLSHEIKTPLAIIRGASETLVESGAEDPEATERFVGRIIEQIYRLEDLLKDLLTLSRLESPEAGQHRQTVDLAVISRRAVELLGPLAARADGSLRSEIEAVPALSGDGKALERLVLNLVMNGIQYNRAGGHVTMRLHGRSDTIELEVADNGVGIPAADLPRIFERFYRVDKGRGRAEGGSGLGLAIVKHVVQAHGGSVDVKSEVDRGSIFRVLLPAAESSPGREGESEETARGEAPSDRVERALVKPPAP